MPSFPNWWIYEITTDETESFLSGTIGGGPQTLEVSGDAILGNEAAPETITVDTGSGPQVFTYAGSATVEGGSGPISGFYATLQAGPGTLQFFFTQADLTAEVESSSQPTVTSFNPDTTPGEGGSDFALCFMAGTRIATPEGERPVESLRPGDLVLTTTGEAKPVVWLGRQTICRTFRDDVAVLPVRIRAGALAEGLPVRDMLLSPCHALALDGVLIQAATLVNGLSILWERDAPMVFPYYHVELDRHTLLLAEGVAAESFIDLGDRRLFDNAADAASLHPIEEMDLPRAKSPRQVPRATRERLLARAHALFGAETRAAA